MTHKAPKFSEMFAAHPEAAAMASYAHVVWAEAIAELEAAGALSQRQKTRLATVERYCRYRAEFHYLYPVCMNEGPVKQGKTGEYVNPKFACMNKLDEKLMKFDDLFWRWCGGKTAKTGERAKTPVAADKYLSRSRGTPADEFLNA